MKRLGVIDSVLPAVICAIAIRLDSRLIGPYWSVSEIVAGMGGFEVELFYSVVRHRFAIIRRFTFPGVAGAVTALIWAEDALARGALMGGLCALLLLWPLLFHGLPWGVARNDWLLLPLYVALLVGFALSGFMGASIVGVVRAEAGDLGLLEYARRLVLPFAGVWLMKRAFSGSFDRLKRMAQDRAEGTS